MISTAEAQYIYKILIPPFKLQFDTMPKAQLKEYNEWFFKIKDERLNILIDAAGLTDDIIFTVDGLKHLGKWLVSEVNEMRRIDDFTGLLSRGFDIGIYLGEFLIKNHPGAYWVQSLENRRCYDFGDVVIKNFFTYDYNTTHVAYNIVTSMRDGQETEYAFIELYDNLKDILLKSTVERVYFKFDGINSYPFAYTAAIKTQTGFLAKLVPADDAPRKITALEAELSNAEWSDFMNVLYLCQYRRWEKEYYSDNMPECKQWDLEVSLSDGEKMIFSGNTYPPNWDKLIEAMNDLHNDVKKKLRKLSKSAKK